MAELPKFMVDMDAGKIAVEVESVSDPERCSDADEAVDDETVDDVADAAAAAGGAIGSNALTGP
jgi:hypothetical protein